MSDPIQAKLEQAHRSGDRQALGEVFTALKAQWAGVVARFLREPQSSTLVDQTLGDLLVDLLLGKDDKQPRALAPSDHPNPVAWRRQVLLRALIDQHRRQTSYGTAVQGHAGQYESASFHAKLPAADEVFELRQMRADVIARLPALDIRRRFALGLELGVQLPLGWVIELSRSLGEPLTDVLRRLRAHAAAPNDEAKKVAVIYGAGAPSATIKENYRKLLERARDDMTELVTRGRS